MLGVSRRMLEGDRRMRREIGYAREDVMGREISGKTVGLVGLGAMGKGVALNLLRKGFAVVADEVRNLAETSEKRSRDVQALAEAIAEEFPDDPIAPFAKLF